MDKVMDNGLILWGISDWKRYDGHAPKSAERAQMDAKNLWFHGCSHKKVQKKLLALAEETNQEEVATSILWKSRS